MKFGDTVYVLHRTLQIVQGILGAETTAQGVYTRWGKGHTVHFTVALNSTHPEDHNDENIFKTREAARKELFRRRLMWPQFFKHAA